MRQDRSQLLLIFGTVLINLIGFGIVIPVLPLYAERFGASPLVIGLLIGIYSAMQCIFTPILGKLSDRVGRRPVLLISILGTSLGFLLMGMAQGLPLLFLGRIIDGITGGNISTAQAYIADVTTPQDRSRGMGLIGAAFGLGFIFGPAIGGLLAHFSMSAPLYFAAALAALNALLVYWRLPESLPAERRGQALQQPSLAQILKESEGNSLRQAMATYFFTTVAFSLLTATYPLFAEHRFGWGATQIGAVFAGVGLLGAVIQGGLMGLLVRRLGEKRLTLSGGLLLLSSLFVLPLSMKVPALLAATTMMAIGHSFMTAPLNAIASKSVGAEVQGRALGAMQSAASFARVLGPVLGGWLLHQDTLRHGTHFGRTPYWTAAAVMCVALGIMSLARGR